jgi:hypothetical protein
LVAVGRHPAGEVEWISRYDRKRREQNDRHGPPRKWARLMADYSSFGL